MTDASPAPTIPQWERTHARDYITSMTTRPYTQTHPYRPDDIYDLGQQLLRDLLCTDEDDSDALDLTGYHEDYKNQPEIHKRIDLIAEHLTKAYRTLLRDYYSRDFISTLCLDNSVCPMHHCDYCACFDDDDEECATIRQMFPSHDT